MAPRFINPPTISKPPGYTHVVEITAPGRTIYIAGQLGIDLSGNMPPDFRGQIVHNSHRAQRRFLVDQAPGFDAERAAGGRVDPLPRRNLGAKVQSFRRPLCVPGLVRCRSGAACRNRAAPHV